MSFLEIVKKIPIFLLLLYADYFKNIRRTIECDCVIGCVNFQKFWSFELLIQENLRWPIRNKKTSKKPEFDIIKLTGSASEANRIDHTAEFGSDIEF